MTSGESEERRLYHETGWNCRLSYSRGNDAGSCSVANLPSSRTGHWGEGITAEDMTALRWVKPKIVAEVSFVEWTRDGLLRHPEFLGLRTDKKAARRNPSL